MPLLLVADFFAQLFLQRLQEIEGDVGGLEIFRVGVGDVVNQRAESACTRRWNGLISASQRGGVDARKQTGSDRFRVAFDAGKLTSK
jgi:hypothetical protein